MGLMRESFIFYRSFYESIKDLPAELQVEVIHAISEYSLYGHEIEMSPMCKALFTAFCPSIQAAKNRYEACVENGKKGAEYGKLGGRPKTPDKTPKQTPKDDVLQTPDKTPKQTGYKPLTDTDTVTDTVTDTENIEIVCTSAPRTRFVKPTLEEVSEYCKSRGNSIDAGRFYDYYQSNGWMVGRRGMKDWKAAVRNWERNDGATTEKATTESWMEQLNRVTGGIR